MSLSSRIWSVAILAAMVAATAPACTLVTNFKECEAATDCTARYGPRAVCGADFVCSTAAEVTTKHCQETRGDLRADSFLIAVLLPLTGPESGFGLPLLRAIETAHSNFSAIEVDGRNVALLLCDTQGLDDIALEAGREAIEEARVTAIIGPDFSSQTLAIANQYAIPNDVLMVTPSGTSTQLTTLEDKNLIWRTAPSDVAQADALAQLVVGYIPEKLGSSLEESVVWLLNRSEDAYGVGLQEALIENFPTELTSSENFKASQYPSDWEDTWFSGTALKLPAPDVVVLMGAAESWAMAEAIDEAFDKDTVFFFADAARNADEASKTGAALQRRVLGTAPQSVGDKDYTPYTNFRIKYQSDHREDPDDFQFVANAYDALHLVVLAAVGGEGITGPQLALGMSRLSAGQRVTANSSGASTAISLLTNKKTVDFEGASGRVDFDENGDPSPSKIILWCFADSAVPEAGDLLTTDGMFHFKDCESIEPTNNTVDADVGSGGDVADMGMTTDMGAAGGTPDAGPLPDSGG